MSIVVPVKNRPDLILRTLDSIKAQTYRPLKVIVVDNGSTDNTVGQVEKWMRDNAAEDFDVQLLHEDKQGPCAARNRGLEAVETRLMMHFDSDDTMEPSHVETIMNRFAQEDNPDLVCFSIRMHMLDGRVRKRRRPSNRLMECHLVHALLSTQAFACETALARRAGGWDESLLGWNDLEYGLRVLLEARRRAYIHDINVDVFSGEISVTGTDFSSRRGVWEEALLKMEKVLEKSLHKNRRKWLKYIPYRQAILAAHYRKEGNRQAAADLLKTALDHRNLSGIDRAYLKLAYAYTARGGRGAYIPARFIF